MKTILGSAGLLATLFFLCTAHAEGKPQVSWFIAHYTAGDSEMNLRTADNEAHTFHIGKAVCQLSETLIGNTKAERSLVCLENGAIVVDLGLRCRYDGEATRNATAELHGKQLELVCSVNR